MGRRSVGINLLWLVPGEVGGSEESTLASVRARLDKLRKNVARAA